jgi:hypothetical protein
MWDYLVVLLLLHHQNHHQTEACSRRYIADIVKRLSVKE